MPGDSFVGDEKVKCSLSSLYVMVHTLRAMLCAADRDRTQSLALADATDLAAEWVAGAPIGWTVRRPVGWNERATDRPKRFR